jgi:hypothetical protein
MSTNSLSDKEIEKFSDIFDDGLINELNCESIMKTFVRNMLKVYRDNSCYLDRNKDDANISDAKKLLDQFFCENEKERNIALDKIQKNNQICEDISNEMIKSLTEKGFVTSQTCKQIIPFISSSLYWNWNMRNKKKKTLEKKNAIKICI